MSHTKYVFVANVDGVKAVPAANTISIVENGSLQSDNGAALVANDTFQVVEGRYGTPVFNANDIQKVDCATTTNGTAQVITVNVVKTATGTANVKLIDVTDGREKFSIATFEAVGAATDAAAATQIAAAINASKRDIFKDVVVTVSTAELTITMPVNVIMRFACNDLSSGSISTAAVLIAGPNAVKIAAGATGVSHRVTVFVKAEVGTRTDLHEIVIYVKDSGSDVLIGHLNTVFATLAPGTIAV
jgi:hypothetical protein